MKNRDTCNKGVSLIVYVHQREENESKGGGKEEGTGGEGEAGWREETKEGGGREINGVG